MTSQGPVRRPRRNWSGPRPEEDVYQSFSPEEDKRRTNVHYELPAPFFSRITGGEWNVYSCNLWNAGMTETESQEAKLDLLAQSMELKPGQRILDVGCGWGGPLVYLCKKYGVQGVGLTLSPTQKRCAEERIARYGVDTRVIECHWRHYRDEQGFDAVYTDEVIVHFNDLAGFFAKTHSLLHDGGRMLNKELHFTHSQYSRLSRAGLAINEIYGYTGNYRTLAQELALLDPAGFEVQQVHQIPRAHYGQTFDRWLSNMHRHRVELEGLVGQECYLRFRRYLKLTRRMVTSRVVTLNIVVAHKH